VKQAVQIAFSTLFKNIQNAALVISTAKENSLQGFSILREHEVLNFRENTSKWFAFSVPIRNISPVEVILFGGNPNQSFLKK